MAAAEVDLAAEVEEEVEVEEGEEAVEEVVVVAVDSNSQMEKK